MFEITTAVGLMLFARHRADVLLLEVGLGGRLDATNVIAHPLASIITPISIDHTDFLGDSIEKIAAEKAGILKRDTPAIVAAQPRDALAVIERQAGRLNAPLKIAGEDWTATEERGRLVYQDEAGLLDLPAPKLYGRHQFENAGLAIAALRAIKPLKIAPAAFEAGVAKADWPARMQRLGQGALVALAPAGSEVWLDGGHNPDGGRAIAAALADLEERVSRPLVLIVGMMATKDCAGFLGQFHRAGAAHDRGADPERGKRHERGGGGRRRARHRAAGDQPRQSHRGAGSGVQARPRSAAAHSHHRLSVSGRRSAARERHAAQLKRKRPALRPAVEEF